MINHCCEIHLCNYCSSFANLQIIDVLRGRGTKQIRDCMSVLTHGSTCMENGRNIKNTQPIEIVFLFIYVFFFNLFRITIFQPQPRILTLNNAPQLSSKPLSKDFIFTVFLLLTHYQPVEFATTSKQESIKETFRYQCSGLSGSNSNSVMLKLQNS